MEQLSSIFSHFSLFSPYKKTFSPLKTTTTSKHARSRQGQEGRRPCRKGQEEAGKFLLFSLCEGERGGERVRERREGGKAKERTAAS